MQANCTARQAYFRPISLPVGNVPVTGFFRDRTYLQDGEEKTLRELIVVAAEIQPKRAAAEAA